MTREHFRVLDGLRGIAAIAVVAYHFGGRADLPYMVPRGYLAVDFFFVLSGLVVSHAYLRPLQGSMGVRRFVLLRVVRLWPMLVPGTILGAVIEVGRPNAGASAHHLAELAGIALLGCLALPWPFPTGMEQVIFPIDGPVWSLFFEIVANLAFVAVALLAWRRPAAWSLALAGAAGLVACTLAFGKADIGFQFGDWGGGLPRVAFSFFAGVLLDGGLRYFRPLRAWLFPAVLLLVFSVPRLPGAFGPGFDLVAILVVFPAVVGFAARADAGWASRLCDVLGRLSYPLYALHYPVIRAICFVVNRHDLPAPQRVAIGLASVALAAGLSWLVLVWYDQPVRAALSRRLLPRRPAPAGGEAVPAAASPDGMAWMLPTKLGPTA